MIASAVYVARTAPLLRCARAFSAAAADATSRWPAVAIVGVGQLGAAVAGNLRRHGVAVTLFDLAGDANVPPALRDAGALDGAAWAPTARERTCSARC